MTREDALKEALEIVKAQASVRAMSIEEMTSMAENVANGIMALDGAEQSGEVAAQIPAIDPAKAIKEKSITCLECGKAFKVITKRHLVYHGLTPDAYRARWGMKKGAPLVCKELIRERRKKMKDMKLWEKRRKAA